MTKAPTPTAKSKKQRDKHKNPTKNFDYTTIADRLRAIIWSNDSHQKLYYRKIWRGFRRIFAVSLTNEEHIGMIPNIPHNHVPCTSVQS